jgi:hypothetical protein
LVDRREVALSQDGAIAFINETYMQAFKEQQEKTELRETRKQLDQSTINTNWWMKVLTIVIAASTLATL